MTRARYRAMGFVAAAVCGLFVALSACSNEAEGERCQSLNGNDDCQNGLVCICATTINCVNNAYGYVNPPYNTSDRCCPADRSQATHPACTLAQAPTGVDSGIPETGPEAASDAAADVVSADADASSAPDAADASDAD